ncbi:hypothetical protein K435DRAFT_793337 [Dendrothele bispora CBS 962.96]|uniref:F-box domain-containing protein n=1 Tax=Dendrothele bispora (strain CBS 962.96) TaxID=1314807 RepID=A0A4S8MFJ2_DENBC|nr:hypothetical protein K435DRAFT_793337 [Dendrothele bispora CBS 962.96]
MYTALLLRLLQCKSWTALCSTIILRLTEFRLPEGSESEIPFVAGGFLSLLQRSNCSQLTTLVVKSPTLGLQYTVISILKHTPSLINLTIYDAVPRSGDLDYLPIITPGFLRGLLVPDSLSLFGSSSIIVPKLRNLWLKARGDTFDEGAFVDMVLSRWLPNGLEHSVYADLEELKFVDLLVVGRRVDKDVWNRLDGVGATGLRVRLLDGLE